MQSTIKTSFLTTPAALTVTDTPTEAQLQAWWEAMRGDDLSVAYADTFPASLVAFRADVAQGDTLLVLGLVAHQVASAFWLHDLVRHHDGPVFAGWIGCYVLPAYRGYLVGKFWHLARQHWEAMGVRHFFTATHVANRRSQAMITREARFHRVGRFPRFMSVRGELTDVFIYALHTTDMHLAWELATARAMRQARRVA